MIRIKDIILVAIVFVLWLFFFKDSSYINKKVDFSDMRNYRKLVEVHDTVYQKTFISRQKKGDSIPYVIIVPDSVQVLVHDTVRIIGDYYAIKAYTDSIKQDSNIFVIRDTISQNKILSRSFEAKITQKTITNRQYFVEKPKNALYLGFRGDFRPSNGLVVLSPSMILNAKNKALIGLGFDLYNNGGFGYSGSLYLKIGKK